MSGPVRTCIGCGVAAARGTLVRLRNAGGSVVVDRRREGGRGAWVHASVECVDRAARRRAFARAFREAAVAVDLAALRAELTGSARKD